MTCVDVVSTTIARALNRVEPRHHERLKKSLLNAVYEWLATEKVSKPKPMSKGKAKPTAKAKPKRSNRSSNAPAPGENPAG